MARERTIGFKLAGFGGTWLFLLFVIVGVGYWAASSIMARLDETTTNTVRRLELAIRVDSLVSRFIADGRGAIQGSLFDDKTLSERSRADLTRHLREAKADTATLESLMRIESGRAAARRLGSLIESFSAAEAQVIGLVDKGDPAAASELAEKTTGPIQADIDKQLTTIVGNQRQFLKEDSDAADVAFARARLTMILLTLVTIAAGALAAWVVAAMMRTLRSGVHDLNVGASQVASASGQVATSAQSLSQGSTEQAASLEETSASMEEMASMTRRNAENSQAAADLINDVDARVQESNHALQDMVTSMAAITESSQKVSKIIKTIDEIAFQTNILALNAAVEAARAGEAGMGFAVVADEVRSLAQRSAQAAKDTSSLIEESIVKAQGGSTKVDQVAAAIGGITDSVTKVKGLVHEVSEASRQQAQGIDQVSQAIQQMEKVTQSTAATAQESAAASEELSAQAETTIAVVRRLEVLVGTDAAPVGDVAMAEPEWASAPAPAKRQAA